MTQPMMAVTTAFQMASSMTASSLTETTDAKAAPAAATRSGAPASIRLWPADEIAWGRECLRAGDSVEEIAEGAGCSLAEVIGNIGRGRLTAQQREVVSLYTAGCAFPDINRELGAQSLAAESMITKLRERGYPIPYRHDWRRFT